MFLFVFQVNGSRSLIHIPVFPVNGSQTFKEREAMEIAKYNPAKTAKKAAIPGLIIILVNVVLSIAKSKGIEIDEAAVWEIALGGYGSIIALLNWIKNHKKGKNQSN